MSIKSRLKEELKELIGWLVNGDYDSFEARILEDSLPVGVIEDNLENCGQTLVLPPPSVFKDVNFRKKACSGKNDSAIRLWSVAFKLWTEEEGESQQSIELRFAELENNKIEIKVIGMYSPPAEKGSLASNRKSTAAFENNTDNSDRKIASTRKQKQAKYELQYDGSTDIRVVAYCWNTYDFGERAKRFFEYSYADEEFECWVRKLQSIVEDEEEHQKVICEWNKALKKQLKENDEEYWRVDLKMLADVFSPWEVPQELIKIAKFQNRKKRKYIENFYVFSDGAEQILNFTRNKLNKDQLKLFAHLGDGDTVGYWVKNSIEDSPIVYVSHECGGCLIASNIREFFQILVSAQPKTDKEWDEWDGFDYELHFAFYADDKREFKKARKWFKRKFDITPVEDGREFTIAAQEKFGNFNDWMEKHGND